VFVSKTVIECHKIAAEISEVEVPWRVWTKFGENSKKVFIHGDQLCLGEDYGNLEEVRSAIAWYVEQLGGKVKWSK
jgi:hypothetical protein